MVPAFSSKGFPKIRLEAAAIFAELELDSVLVSAYDVYHGHMVVPVDFAGIIFLDSGGYEVQKEHEPLDWRHSPHSPDSWNSYSHLDIVDSWPEELTTILISYDHPSRRSPLADQVDVARELFARCPERPSEILLKPECLSDVYLDIAGIASQVDLLRGFDVIGITEKELGKSVKERVLNIHRLRKAMTTAGIDSPIHVLGSLDTLVTPLYFLAGADIFDGLSWLRFHFVDGQATYALPSGAAAFGTDCDLEVVKWAVRERNVYYLADRQLELRRFARTRNFSVFRHNSGFLEREAGLLLDV
ncbi:MAG: hypothetical protein ACYTKD_20500 [Planctomycetota bacterium]